MNGKIYNSAQPSLYHLLSKTNFKISTETRDMFIVVAMKAAKRRITLQTHPHYLLHIPVCINHKQNIKHYYYTQLS